MQPLCDIDIQGDVSPEDEALMTPPAKQAGEPQDAQQSQKAVRQHIDKSAEHRIGDALPKLVESGRHVSFATPAVRGLLKELDIKIEEVRGTGRDGRVLKDDVHKFAASQDSLSTTESAFSSDQSNPSVTSSQKNTVITLTPIQSQMFKTMTRSLSIPHFLYADEIDLSPLDTIRARLKALSPTAENTTALTLSYLPFIIKAVSIALKDFPLLNSRVEYDPTKNDVPPRLVMREKHNIGVAIDTPQGLLVPNIKNVDALSILQIADQIKLLHKLAQASKLTASDLTGGTITVSNVGSIGGTYVSPVIVQSEVAILGVGKARTVPAFNNIGDVEKKMVGNFSWSADHRVVDGATMARMGERVRRLIEEPGLMLVSLR